MSQPQAEAASVAKPDGAPVAAAAARPQAGRWAGIAAKYAPVAVVAATMAVLGVWGLARHSSMGNDEVATRWAALLSLRDLAHLLNTVDAVHGLYYLIMHWWMAVGTSPAVMRIPSVIGMTAAAALTVIIARRLTGSAWAGLFAGLIMAVTPVISYYAQTARSYALVLACVLGSTLALMHAMTAEAAGAPAARTARRWLVYGALVTIGAYLNELSLLVLAAHAITVLLARYGRRAVVHWAVTAAVSAVLAVPLMVISARQHAAVSWIGRPTLADLKVLFHDYFGATTAVALLVLVCALAALVPERTPWWRGGGLSLPSVAAPLLVVPAVILILESLVAPPLYVDRYVLYGEAGAALLAGAGVYRIGRWLGEAAGRRELIWAPGAVVCVCALLLQLGAQQRDRTPQSRSFDFGGPSRYVGANARPGDGVLFFGTFYRKARLGYPADFAKTSDFAMAVSPAQAGTFRGRDKPFSLTGPLMLERRRIWVVGRVPSARLADPALRAESVVLKSRFSLIGKRHFRGVAVTLWLRRG